MQQSVTSINIKRPKLAVVGNVNTLCCDLFPMGSTMAVLYPSLPPSIPVTGLQRELVVQKVVGIPPERIVDATEFAQLGSFVMEALASGG
jgi:hypothetical protein